MRNITLPVVFVCILSACLNPAPTPTVTLLHDQLGFPLLSGLEPCPHTMTVMDGNRERAVCGIVRDQRPDAPSRLVAAYSQLAISSGWSSERLDENRAYLRRTRQGCGEMLMIAVAEGPNNEKFIMFDIEPAVDRIVTGPDPAPDPQSEHCSQ